jgi:hypothetical protein
VPIVFSVTYLTSYINEMRRRAKHSDALLVSLHDKNKELSYEYLCKMLRRLADRAGIKKPVNPHAWRHASATRWAGLLTDQQLKAYLGWTPDSKMAGVYVHLSGKNLDDAVKKAHGLDVSGEPEKPKLTVKSCHKCHSRNEMTAKCCSNCGTGLDKSAVERVNEIEAMQQKLEYQNEVIKGLKDTIDELGKVSGEEEKLFEAASRTKKAHKETPICM